jgi:hypothetical protein
MGRKISQSVLTFSLVYN